MGINIGKIKYSQLIEATGLNPIKLNLILKVLKAENLLSFDLNLDRDTIQIEVLPRPDSKLAVLVVRANLRKKISLMRA